MRKARRVKIAAWATTLLALVGLTIVATGFTGAYFSDSHAGTISGNLGSIKITPSGGTGTDSTNLSFTNMLPGVPQTVTLNYSNSGLNAEDVWIVFNNATALSSLNNLGTYGEVHVAANGNDLFDSANLNDRASTCGPFSPTGCWPVPQELKVASNVAPTGTGSVSFTFNYASKLSNPAAENGSFNGYPVSGQTTVNAADGTGNGLPYEIVATQVGQTP
jgi:hypothetical protein